MDEATHKPAPIVLVLSSAADKAMEEFQRWLEPQLGMGKQLSLLAGWANKLAGAVARLAGILHMAQAVDDGNFTTVIAEQTVQAHETTIALAERGILAASRTGALADLGGDRPVGVEHDLPEAIGVDRGGDARVRDYPV